MQTQQTNYNSHVQRTTVCIDVCAHTQTHAFLDYNPRKTKQYRNYSKRLANTKNVHRQDILKTIDFFVFFLSV